MRKRWLRVLFYILLNVAVSALTTYLVVSYMLRANLIPGTMPTLPLTAEQEAPESAAPVGDVVPDQLEINSVVGAGDLENERILIQHIGDVEIDLEGWQLVDEQGNSFDFPALTMFSGGAVTVYTKVGVNNVVELFWGLDTAVFQEGEQVQLLDPQGVLRATYRVP